MSRNLPAWALLLLAVGVSPSALAVIVPNDALPTPGHDTSTVPVTLAGHSLSDYIGMFGSFLGTPISPRYFLTANHITGATTGAFTYNNGTGTPTSYNVVRAGVQDDLAIWKIADSEANSFSLFAPIYTATDTELSRPLIDLGRGTFRGSAILNGSGQTIGYTWGAPSGDLTWGSNTVDRFDTDTTDPGFGGSLLAFTFDENGNPGEAALSSGDSGGPVFVQDADGFYKLAGVNSLVDGQFSTNANSDYFDASMFDARGYFEGSPSNHVFVDPDPAVNPGPVPSSSYATRVSTRLAFIAATTGIAVPEPAGVSVALLLCAPALFRRRPRPLPRPT